MLVIYGRENCSYCFKAKILAEMKKIPYDYIDVQKDEVALDKFKLNNWTTVPQIMYNDVHIGGYAELEKILKEIGD